MFCRIVVTSALAQVGNRRDAHAADDYESAEDLSPREARFCDEEGEDDRERNDELGQQGLRRARRMHASHARQEVAESIQEADPREEIQRIREADVERNIVREAELVNDEARAPDVVHEDSKNLPEEGQVLAKSVEDEFSADGRDD